MAINQNGLPEHQMRLIQLPLQRRVIGLPVILDPVLCFGHAQLARIDRLPIGHNARNDTQPRGHTRIMPLPRHTFDQCWVQFIGAAVQIDIGAWCPRLDQRRSMERRAVKQLIDKRILGRAHRMLVQGGAPQKGPRVIPPTMGRGEHHRRGPPFGMREVIGDLGHACSFPP